MVEKFVTYSQRRGITPRFELEEGIPLHLQGSLSVWFSTYVPMQEWYVNHLPRSGFKGAYLQSVINDLRLPVSSSDWEGRQYGVKRNFEQFNDITLDIVDHLLAFLEDNGNANYDSAVELLERILAQAGSVHSAASGRLGLRVEPALASVATEAISQEDLASGELNEAWHCAYGRSPDASDAWDHAIKAVEALLAPIVTPNDRVPTLGKMLAVLRDAPEKWRFALRDDVELFRATVSLIWPNPDRHGNEASRAPSLEESRVVVTLATTVVQWLREGHLQRVE